MLEIQNFILKNKNWRELLSSAPYNLKISVDGEYVLLKYNQINSDFNEQICREARGIIIHIPTNKVVRLAFFKFFNLSEPFADKIDWSTAVATEKIDGSIMTLWFHNSKWNLSTNGTINAFNAIIGDGKGKYKNFGELFYAAAQNSGLDIEKLNKNCNYTFELVSPFNRIVIDYPEPDLYLLSVRNINTLDEVYPVPTNLIQTPTEYKLKTEEDYQNLVNSMGEGHEGIVVRDANGRRVKIKTLLYFQLHKMANNGQITLEKTVSLIRVNDYDEFLSYFPQHIDYFEKIKVKIDEAMEEIRMIKLIVDLWKKTYNGSRKDFAKDVFEKGKKGRSQFFFAAYDNRLEELIEGMSDEKFIKVFELGE